MLDAIFVLAETEMTANCLADSFGLQRHICVGADDSWLILFQLQIGYVFQKKKKNPTPSSTYI